ncbi:hypothetical protein [Roseivirga misakiensis]|uniref:Uncharacterized protein n=1 Tax=Roseivirga misakiensis TaxID=1563681 RepID=A0A1E5SYP0_9BACT|nr:hypothetical protein [Roseivirga misakiensis]OEK04231.1 hypothetical protein BFP71_12160 [Roseivirga misakiensis]
MNIDVVFFLKFGQKEHIDNLLKKGEIFLNTIQWFKKYEKDGIGDIYEGAYEVDNLSGKLTLEIPNNPIVLNNANLQLRKHHEGHIGNIFSTYAISTLLLKRKPVHRIDVRMRKFGTHCLIIKNPRQFIDSITDKLTNMGIEHSHDIVQYKNLKKKNHKMSLFDKTHLLSYQKEHRIIAWTEKDCALKFEIGSIEHYAEMHSTDKIIETLTVECKK